MVEAVVDFDYDAKEPDELTIKKGDVLRDVLKKPGGWWEGTLNDKRGMFPDNFVHIVHGGADRDVTLRNKGDLNRLRKCRALFSYHPAHEDELSLSVGDVIDVLGEVEEGWWRGKLAGAVGVFPSNFVVELEATGTGSKPGSKEDLTSLAGETDMNGPSLPPKPAKILCQAKYAYEACNDDELTLKEGDIITLVSKDGQDKGWWRGELRGQVGVFPDNFVVLLPLDQNKSIKQERKAERSHSAKAAPSPYQETVESAPRPTSVALSRKSLENKAQERAAPPILSKKPAVPLKKSPSATNVAGGILSGLGFKKKASDSVDGSAGSKPAVPTPVNVAKVENAENNDFDQVERNVMLSDPRMNRAKPPSRRPPSAIYREGELGLMNGNADHGNLPSIIQSDSNSSVDEIDEGEKKPKVREWEKHKAPWVEELKLNQAKRTSPVTPNSSESGKLKLTPTYMKSISPSDSESLDEGKSPAERDTSPGDLRNKLKTSPSPLDVTKTATSAGVVRKPNQPITTTPIRPQSIYTTPEKVIAPQKLEDTKGSGDAKKTDSEKRPETVPYSQYSELLERVANLESSVEQKFQEMRLLIDDLRGKLQVETDMRILLQAELEKVSQCLTQV